MTLSTVAIIGATILLVVGVAIVLLNAIEFRPPPTMLLSPLSSPPPLSLRPAADTPAFRHDASAPAPPHPANGPAPPLQAPTPPLRLVTWNLGFASLDARMDYFTDGGRRSRGFGREHTEANLATIIATLREIDADIIFLQEVDRRSARSHYVDQVTALRSAFPDHTAYFAANLVSPHIPVPFRRPIGRVHSGLMTLVRASLSIGNEARRVALPGLYPFPKRVFHVKRCFLEVPLRRRNRDLSLINLHHSAYDTGGTFRTVQTEAIINRMREIEAAGAIAIAGGDWNGIFPGIASDRFAPWTTHPRNLEWLQRICPSAAPASWRWLYDPTHPTVRTNDRPYIPGETYRTVVDGFLATSRIGQTETRGINTGFGPSDHQPVVLVVKDNSWQQTLHELRSAE